MAHIGEMAVNKATNLCVRSQEKQLIPLYIFISVSFELSLYSLIAGLDDNIQWNELLLLGVKFLVFM